MDYRTTIYLDTSVPNFLFADDAPEKKEITIELFDKYILPEKYTSYISEFVIGEIEDTHNEEKRLKLLDVIEKYPIKSLVIDDKFDEIIELGQKYVNAGIIPEKKIVDAYHIAVSTIYKIDFLVSWNFRHLANVNKEQQVRIVNLKNNYKHNLRIITPLKLF